VETVYKGVGFITHDLNEKAKGHSAGRRGCMAGYWQGGGGMRCGGGLGACEGGVGVVGQGGSEGIVQV
jgi:hypothetical protein